MSIDYELDLPARMRSLPRDDAGRPVPKFVETVDGKPDFRIMSGAHLRRAIRARACWVCGDPLGRWGVFTAGPMCLVNLNSAEPPSHLECAVYSATHCPFMSNPTKVRREAHMPGVLAPAGISIARNPGVTALIVAHRWAPYHDPHGGPGALFAIGEPSSVHWYARGRRATRAEVIESLDGGMPTLIEACDGDQRALTALAECSARAMRWVPG